ncbi:MAG: acetyl-CoA carboxylase biotin carboxyl carrier protein [Sphingomonadales bacterium]|nr:acetyl-CoA carboxylase biotin carboxyl carrier protein [Sphingomonadales bacterium]
MSMDLTHSDVQCILKIIDAAEHLEEIEIVHGGFRLHVVRNGSGKLAHTTSVQQTGSEVRATASAPAASEAALANVRPPATAPTSVPEGVVAIRAPMLGVFYRAQAPGEKPFVEVGQRVRADDTVCLIEVMKLFNSVRAGVDGEVVNILADNGGLVEFDQALIFVKPS